MKIYISSSGERSKAIASILHHWLPYFIQAVQPFSLEDDVPMGARAGEEISAALEGVIVGIICVTRENLKDMYIMFEAGALSNSLKKSLVCPLLFGVIKSDLEGPLLSFQAAEFKKNEVLKLLNTINSVLQEPLEQDKLNEIFEVFWPRLEAEILAELGKDSAPPSQRNEREILEEILERSRVAGRLEREFKGRLLSSLGYVIGELSIQPRGKIDRDRLHEAVRHCQQGYNLLKEVGGAPEFFGLNNLIFYSTLLNEPSKRDTLLGQARQLRKAAEEHKATNLILTACGAILKLSPDAEERREARERLTALLGEPISEKERKEANAYLGGHERGSR